MMMLVGSDGCYCVFVVIGVILVVFDVVVCVTVAFVVGCGSGFVVFNMFAVVAASFVVSSLLLSFCLFHFFI